MFFDNRYNESDWRADCDARELDALRDEARDMEELIIESTPRSTGGVLAHVGEYVCKAGWCEGSGFTEEYIAEDQTQASHCMGCPACQEEESELERSRRRAPVTEIPLPKKRVA